MDVLILSILEKHIEATRWIKHNRGQREEDLSRERGWASAFQKTLQTGKMEDDELKLRNMSLFLLGKARQEKRGKGRGGEWSGGTHPRGYQRRDPTLATPYFRPVKPTSYFWRARKEVLCCVYSISF